MVLGNTTERYAEVRRLAGGLSTHDVSAEDLDRIILRQDNWVEVETNNFNWDSTDNRFNQVLQASNLMSAAEAEDAIPTPEARKAAADHRIAARDIIKAINRVDVEAGQDAGAHAARGVNITDELDPDNYTQEASV